MTEQHSPKAALDETETLVGKHTPGPWYAMTRESGGLLDQATVCSEHETDGEPTFIADTMGLDGEVPLEQRKANARLIAAALLMADYISKRAAGGDSEAEKIMEAIHANS